MGPVLYEFSHCRRSGTNVFHRQPAVADAVIVRFCRHFSPSEVPALTRCTPLHADACDDSEVHHFFSEVPHFRSLRHLQETDLEKIYTPVTDTGWTIPWPRCTTRIMQKNKKCRIYADFGLRSPVNQKPFHTTSTTTSTVVSYITSLPPTQR